MLKKNASGKLFGRALATEPGTSQKKVANASSPTNTLLTGSRRIVARSVRRRDGKGPAYRSEKPLLLELERAKANPRGFFARTVLEPSMKVLSLLHQCAESDLVSVIAGAYRASSASENNCHSIR
jgi:hypothetical protein